MIVSIIMLSLVVLTGFVGQISLAQASLAGIAGFALSKVTVDLGCPFPLSLAMSSSVLPSVGVVIGVPRCASGSAARGRDAGRRGRPREVRLPQPGFTSSSGNPIAEPILFGVDVSVPRGPQRRSMVSSAWWCSAGWSATARRRQPRRERRPADVLAVRSNERAAAAAGIDVASTEVAGLRDRLLPGRPRRSLIGYSRGQLSADSFTAVVGLSLLAFAYLGGISSVAGALVAGIFYAAQSWNDLDDGRRVWIAWMGNWAEHAPPPPPDSAWRGRCPSRAN